MTDDAGQRQTGELSAVRQSGPPQFLTAGGELGRRFGAFSVPYEAEDPFPEARLSLRVSLDGTIIETAGELQSPLRLSAAIDEELFNGLAKNTVHTLEVRLENEFSLSASIVFRFTPVSDPTAGCTFYLLRDGRAVDKKKGTDPFYDYGAAGSHRYQVRIVDPQGGFCDSNEVTAVSRIPCAMIAPLSDPVRMIQLPLQKDEIPLRRSLLQSDGQLCRFEGRDYAVLEQDGGRKQDFTVRALLDEETYQQVLALSEADEPVLYRDPYGSCAAAAIRALPAVLSAQGIALELQLTRIDEAREVAYD